MHPVEKRLKVAIDFRVPQPRQGVGMTLIALARGLARLNHPRQQYVFVVYDHSVSWLEPHMAGNCSVIGVPSSQAAGSSLARRLLRSVPGLRSLARMVPRPTPPLATSDGVVEELGCDLVHFPSQSAYVTRLPSIYQPWDLQHRHLPQFFSRADYAHRDLHYRAYCERATTVCIATDWGKRDLVAQYGLPESKIEVVRWGTPLESSEPLSEQELAEVRKEYALPASFLLYPAITWPHKNHEELMRALALRRQQTEHATHLYLTGAPFGREARLMALARSLGVGGEVHFLGFVCPRHLEALYHLASALIFPSRFEGLGLPVLEAFRAGLPVACANTTVLPEVVGDAAILFDPESPEDIARAIDTVLTSEATRAQLVAKGREVVKGYSCDAAALQFTSLYERIGRQIEA
jgi:glycosyltransferase involved in cell wall biosynthesis